MILQWHETGISPSTVETSAQALVYGPCLCLKFSTGRYAFYAPDGHRTTSEQALIDYMDKKYGLQTRR